ncbi:DUF883 family protein [Mitsuaria sp. WAJ17]|uniref:DUF883 family protein n=1 Tax=Mitsuaria sp. WAJ17 TaxID=2761452 RepID=UPI0016008C30|nr:DUF883 family protein [Mitsuaria sp. WAJ17]MBB2487671.1 DUF883 family protein [Mitsuaria sp. WAJ17]
MASSASNLSSSPSSTGASGASRDSVPRSEDLLSPGGEDRPARGQGGNALHQHHVGTEGAERSGKEALDRWVERLHAGIDRLAGAAAPRLQRLQDGVSATRSTLRRQAHLVREDGEEWAESLRCTVREHPVTAVALAAAVGLLLGRLNR